MSINQTIRHNIYFAAANGYTGFRSYFGSVFNSSSFERIYVLKGGPGTGKSTLMKRVRLHFDEKAHTESILCSSDINSLDGVIIEANGKRCAVLDGTAPHERDAVIPGAIDEIANLGDGWNSSLLGKEKDEILKINKHKKLYYSYAYKMLALAGNVDEEINKILLQLLNKSKLSDTVNSIIEKKPEQTPSDNIKTKLLCCFGKSGKQSISYENMGTVFLDGIHNCAYFVMDELNKVFTKEGLIREISPSVFNPEKTYALSLSGIKYCVEKNENAIDCSEIINTPGEVQGLLLNELSEIKERLLTLSQNYFDLASKEHFKLEDIYSCAMDFKNGDIWCEKIIGDFNKILNI